MEAGAEPDSGTFHLIWQEHGAGTANDAARQAQGFGIKLLMRVIPAMLRGKAQREFTEQGLVYRLDAPLSSIRPNSARAGDEPSRAAEIVDRTFGQ